MEKGSQNENCHVLELCLNMILSTLLHEEEQSQVVDVVRITWESEEVVLIYTSCKIDSKMIMLGFVVCLFSWVCLFHGIFLITLAASVHIWMIF